MLSVLCLEYLQHFSKPFQVYFNLPQWTLEIYVRLHCSYSILYVEALIDILRGRYLIGLDVALFIKASTALSSLKERHLRKRRENVTRLKFCNQCCKTYLILQIYWEKRRFAVKEYHKSSIALSKNVNGRHFVMLKDLFARLKSEYKCWVMTEKAMDFIPNCRSKLARTVSRWFSGIAQATTRGHI